MRRPAFVLPILLLASACMTDRQANSLSGSAAEGRAFAEANCGGCHAMDDGASPHPDAPSLRRAVNRLPEPMVEGSLEAGIQIGHTTQMPIFVFEEGDIADLHAYFETLKTGSAE